MKKIVIMGATSGMGREVAIEFARAGWFVGIAGRRTEKLMELQQLFPANIKFETIDIRKEDAPLQLNDLIEKLGGMDVYLHSSGMGNQNINLQPDIELNTVETNAKGFVRMLTAVFNYFKYNRCGHIAVISSIAGTKGMGAAPAYSAVKRFQNTYIDALAQLAHMEGFDIKFTDIRPGFVATEFLKDDTYPLLMTPEYAGKQIYKTILKKKRKRVINRKFRILVYIWKLIPQFVWEHLKIK